MSSNILVIDDETTILDNIKFVLELEGHEVTTTTEFSLAKELLKNPNDDFDVVITDMRMPKYSGLDVLKFTKKLYPDISVIILTGHGDIDNAILAMKEGAFEYLGKPVDAEKLNLTVKSAISQKEILTENKKLQKEILDNRNYLKSLQKSAEKILLNLLPEKMPKIPKYKFASKYRSSDDVGGDLYNVFEFDDYIFFYVFDVSSHGILASVITVMLSSFLQNIEYIYNDYMSSYTLENIIKTLNTKLYHNTGQDVFVTMFIGFINKENHELNYVSAGHITQFLSRRNALKPLDSTGPILGVFLDSTFESQKIKLCSKDKIILYTDGIIEAENEDNILGEKSIEQYLQDHMEQSVYKTIEGIYRLSSDFCHQRFYDDVTLLGIEKI